MSVAKTKITVAYGDGIGPQIMEATLRILMAAQARIETEVIDIGEKVYLSGISSGISDASWASIRSTKVFLKSPITTPQGGGYKSLNVTARKALGLYANVRPVRTLTPYVASKHQMDLVIVRENEEDLYAGIEHQQTFEVVQCIKLISRPGCERIVRYAFEYARINGRKKVTCLTKDNIMKMTDGLFHNIFNQIGEEYPEIEKDHKIIDIGAALLADSPERFDVLVTLNLYGDIVSDIAAQVAGSVGLCGSSNIGEQCAMFEAIHGSAPDISGQDIANPSGLLNGALLMLLHINQPDIAEKIENAWLKTLEDGIHTSDIYTEGLSKQRVGTSAFADAVIERLGQKPTHFTPADYSHAVADGKSMDLKPYVRIQAPKKELLGVDIFVEWNGLNPKELGESLQKLDTEALKLSLLSNRGLKVWPDVQVDTLMTNHWRCRFKVVETDKVKTITHTQITELLNKVAALGHDFIKTENLYSFDGVKGFSLGQGE